MQKPRTHRVWLVLPFIAGLAGLLHGEPDPVETRVAALIGDLGDRVYARREAAGRELTRVGESALPALRVAQVQNESPEIRRRARNAIRSILMSVRVSKSLGLEMTFVDEGGFEMGSPKEETGRQASEEQHKVRLTRPFLMGVSEVTQDEYERVMKRNPSWFTKTGGGKDKVVGEDTATFPVEMVSWYDAVSFCNELSKLDGFPAFYTLEDVKTVEVAGEGKHIRSATVTIAGGNGYHLPTEAEWEWACRAWSQRPFHFGYENTGKEANLRPGPPMGYGGGPTWPILGRTCKVKSYPANAMGLFDTHGNVAEWCQDWYAVDYYKKSPVDDPKGPDTGTQRVVRGGSWLVNERVCRSASRHSMLPEDRGYNTGFRVARTP